MCPRSKIKLSSGCFFSWSIDHKLVKPRCCVKYSDLTTPLTTILWQKESQISLNMVLLSLFYYAVWTEICLSFWAICIYVIITMLIMFLYEFLFLFRWVVQLLIQFNIHINISYSPARSKLWGNGESSSVSWGPMWTVWVGKIQMHADITAGKLQENKKVNKTIAITINYHKI